jgi:hypothetical protein
LKILNKPKKAINMNAYLLGDVRQNDMQTLLADAIVVSRLVDGVEDTQTAVSQLIHG